MCIVKKNLKETHYHEFGEVILSTNDFTDSEKTILIRELENKNI